MITQQEIADHLGVSRRLVGFALNGNGTISVKTAHKIRAAAIELGYQPNSIARAMATGKNPVLGFITWNPDSATTAHVLRGVLEGAESHEYFVKVLQVKEPNIAEIEPPPTWDPSVDQCIDRCLELRVAGVIATELTLSTAQRLHERLTPHHIPVVLVEITKNVPWGIHVISDAQQGYFTAIDHLVKLGHRRIGVLAGPLHSRFSPWRIGILREAMRAHGLEIPDHLIAHAHWTAANADEAARQLLQSHDPPPTAIVCEADDFAMCVLRTARSLGLSVPFQLSVIGFGDHHGRMAQLADPPLTTVVQPFRDMGDRAVQCVMERLQTDHPVSIEEAEENRLPTRLVLRQSTAPPVSSAVN